MSARKLKKRSALLQYRREVFRTYELGTGRYAGTYAIWNETRERARGLGMNNSIRRASGARHHQESLNG